LYPYPLKPSASGEQILMRPSLEQIFLKDWGPKTLVYMSASCSMVEMGSKWMRPFFNFPLTMWQSISICFVCSWNTGFVAMYLTESLSQYKRDGCSKGTCKSWRRYTCHWISHVTMVIG